MVESSLSLAAANPPLHLHGFVSERESQEFYEMQGKWWHKFGHSRRGLEHFTSNSEGRQRHSNALSAIHSVLEEQQRQIMFLPKGYFDVDRFRSVYLKQTQWARLLARAAGASDADALQANFDESRRKPREHYMKKYFNNNSDHIATNNNMDMPNYMKSIVSPTRPTKNLNLDANTSSQICFRKSRVISEKSKLKCEEKKKKRTKLSNKSATVQESLTTLEEKKDEDVGVEKDDASACTEDSSTSYLAKMAAGWGCDESSSSREDMSFVLVGMGITAHPKMTVG